MTGAGSGREGAGRTRLLAAVGVQLALLASGPAAAGPYADPGHGNAAMHAWAFEVFELVRGPMDVAEPELGDASYGLEEDVLGPASGPVSNLDVLTLGDGGSIVLGFEAPIYDGEGVDFAVFENGFSDEFGLFAEFAYVEVSSDGVSFARFDAICLRTTSVLPFEEVDPSDYYNLAGDQPTGLGTGFDLEELAQHPLVVSGDVDLDEIYYVRVVDVIGDGTTMDSLGNPIRDPYPTPFPNGGFDLDGVGAIHVPEPDLPVSLGAGWLALLGLRRVGRRGARPADGVAR